MYSNILKACENMIGDFKWIARGCVNVLSPTIVCAIAGVTTISVVSSVHLFVSRSIKLIRSNNKRTCGPCMKGVVIRSYRGISAVEVRRDLPIPKIVDQDEILIKVIAAGLNNVDLLVTRGYGRAVRSLLLHEHPEDDLKVVLGRECSGIVLDTGSDVTTVFKGDEVWVVSSYCSQGLMSEYIVVKECQVSKKPKNLTFEEAASLPYTAIQGCNVILQQACLTPKETKDKRILFITGNSPIGLFGIQLLKAWGGNITTSVPTAGLPMCHELAADDIIVYTVTDFEAEFRKRKRFDIVINEIGTVIHQLCLDISRPGGKVVTLTATPILSDEFDVFFGSLLALLLQLLAWIRKLKRGVLNNFWWSNFTYKREYLVKTALLVEEGKIHPTVERIYDIEEALRAFQQLARYDNVGKNVLRISKQMQIRV